MVQYEVEVETVPKTLQVTKSAVRRFLLARQGLLTKPRAQKVKADDVMEVIQGLECVQLDPVAAVERNQHLVLSARMPKYTPKLLERLLADGRVFEYWANAMCAIPMGDYPMFEVIRRRIEQRLQPALDRLGSVGNDVLKRLEAEGPLPAKAFTSEERVHGYWDNTHAKTKATSHALNLLNDTGRIQVVRREGTTRFFDLRERAVPRSLLDEAARISDAEARHLLVDKYIRAYRVFDASDARFGWQHTTAAERRDIVHRLIEQGNVTPLDIEGMKRPYFVLSDDVEALMRFMTEDAGQEGTRRLNNVQFLGPLDNLLWRRERIEDLFGFSYTWEVYTPAVKRRYGYYAMPVLVGDALVGRVDPRLDRERGLLNVRLLQIEPHVRWTKALRNLVFRGLEGFARFHGAELGAIQQTEPDGLTI